MAALEMILAVVGGVVVVAVVTVSVLNAAYRMAFRRGLNL